MARRCSLSAVVAVAALVISFFALGAIPPASAATQSVVLSVKIEGPAPDGLQLDVQLACIPRGGIPRDYPFTGAGTQTIDVAGAGNCSVNVFDNSRTSTSVNVTCVGSGTGVTCTSDTAAKWDVPANADGTATFAITAVFPPTTTTTEATTTTEPTTTTSSSTTTTEATTTSTAGGTSTTSSSSTTSTTLATRAVDGGRNNLIWFILAGLAFMAVLGTLVWYLTSRKNDDENGPGPDGPGTATVPPTPAGPAPTSINNPAWGPPPDTAPPSTPTPPSGYGPPPGPDEPPPTVANPGLS